MRQIKYIDAVKEALAEEMERDDRVFIIAEDVGEYGGVWNETRGLRDRFGDLRVMDTPISEAGFTGLCVGAAMAGMRPVTEIMYMDFVTACMDQLVNQGAKADLMSGWQMTVPLTVIMPCGFGTREAGQHSQFLEGWFLTAPGFKVVYPSNAYDAKGLMKTAVRDDSPVIFIENRNMLYDVSEVPDGTWTIPFGKAKVLSEGRDITVVTYGGAVPVVREAVRLCLEISAEVIDLRSLLPLDMDAIASSIRKTGRVLVVHEAPAAFNIGAEIVRRVVERCFDDLDAEPLVYGSQRSVVPFSGVLEDSIMLKTDRIVELMKRLAYTGHACAIAP